MNTRLLRDLETFLAHFGLEVPPSASDLAKYRAEARRLLAALREGVSP